MLNARTTRMLAENQLAMKNEIDNHALILLQITSSKVTDLTIEE